jgi:glutamate N-acetyltransferase/amino-acid N-acetyltransferase
MTGSVARTASPAPVNAERRAVLPAGFRAGGTIAGIKASGRPDLALITVDGDAPAAAAAVFTLNAFAAAPVRRSRANLAATAPAGGGRFGWARAIVSTSGCANAATGPAGDDDQDAVGAAVARATGVAEPEVLHLSTGVIGTRLPLPLVAVGLDRLAAALGGAGSSRGAGSSGGGGSSPGAAASAADIGLGAAAEALRTTDSVAKVATVTITLPSPDGAAVTVTVSGMAKGVGMIHPRMATMLAVVLTDATADPATLDAILRPAAARTWNQISVDGDTSTNDTVFLLASGAAGAAPVTIGSPAAERLTAAVEAVARDLARQQVADGEGATTLITCRVAGATDDADARAVARAVVASSLLKAAIHGRDPNWGRVAGAAGNARLADAPVLEAAGLAPEEAAARGGLLVPVDPARVAIRIAGHVVFDGAAGGPVPADRATIRSAMAGPEVVIELDVGSGPGSGEAFGCDLTEAYVIENSEYTT